VRKRERERGEHIQAVEGREEGCSRIGSTWRGVESRKRIVVLFFWLGPGGGVFLKEISINW
jgi:hypothetical protein